MDTTITFMPDDLTERARRLLELWYSQRRDAFGSVLAGRLGDGQAEVDLSGDSDSDDTLRVLVDDKIGYLARARRYGIGGLERSQSTGEISSSGNPIPTEEHLEGLAAMYGDDLDRGNSRYFETPHAILQAVRRGKLAGAQAMDAIAEAFEAWCAEGGWEPHTPRPRGRPTKFDAKMRQTAVWLPQDMADWLTNQPGGASETVRRLIRTAMDDGG